jgi:hypothetical protein
MIEPTIGRVVWFWPPKDRETRVPRFSILDVEKPCSAQIAFVHFSGLLNLVVADHAGQSWGFERVELYQGEGERPFERFCEWMPYQKGQAAKTEALEAKIAGA